MTNEVTELLDQLRAVLEKQLPPSPVTHDRGSIHVATAIGDRAADLIAAFFGGWGSVGFHAIFFTFWFVLHLDINLLTMIVSLEAIFLTTFVMMSQNRQSSKDRVRDDMEASEVGDLFTMNQQQLTILNQQSEILAILKAQQLPASTEPTSSAV
jgi:uncharacterized membrane protein